MSQPSQAGDGVLYPHQCQHRYFRTSARESQSRRE